MIVILHIPVQKELNHTSVLPIQNFEVRSLENVPWGK